MAALITQLEGFEAPAAAWEAEILPARLDNYDFTWLDDLCLAGRAVWTRLTAPARIAARSAGADPHDAGHAVAATQSRQYGIARFLAPSEPSTVSARAQTVVDHLTAHGACFFDEIVEATGMLRTQVEDALAELVVLGLVHSDSFAGLRALLTPSERRKPLGGRRRRRTALFGIEDAGRWALVRRPAARLAAGGARTNPTRDRRARRATRCCAATASSSGASSSARRRGCRRGASCCACCGVWKRAAKSAAADSSPASPASSSRCPKRSALLRETRRAPPSSSWISLSAADPLNLIGNLLPGPRVPAVTGNRIVFRDGAPVAALIAGETQWMQELAPREMREAESVLVKRQAGSPLLAYLR